MILVVDLRNFYSALIYGFLKKVFITFLIVVVVDDLLVR